MVDGRFLQLSYARNLVRYIFLCGGCRCHNRPVGPGYVGGASTHPPPARRSLCLLLVLLQQGWTDGTYAWRAFFRICPVILFVDTFDLCEFGPPRQISPEFSLHHLLTPFTGLKVTITS